jgi:hypothetical protein
VSISGRKEHHHRKKIQSSPWNVDANITSLLVPFFVQSLGTHPINRPPVFHLALPESFSNDSTHTFWVGIRFRSATYPGNHPERATLCLSFGRCTVASSVSQERQPMVEYPNCHESTRPSNRFVGSASNCSFTTSDMLVIAGGRTLG